MPLADDVLKYLSRQGFGISIPSLRDSLSLTEWNRAQLRDLSEHDRIPNLLGIETDGEERGLIVRPTYEDIPGEYVWQPGIRQLFSGLEIKSGDKGSMIIDSPNPILFGKIPIYFLGRDLSYFENYSQIQLLRTARD